MRFHPRGNSVRRAKNKLSRLSALLSCEALEERRMLSTIGIIDGSFIELPGPGLRIEALTVSDGVHSQDSGDLFFRPDRLAIKFSHEPTTAGGDTGEHSASNPANWRLLKGDADVSYLIASVEVSSVNAVLMLSEALSPGSYRLVASVRIQDENGWSIRDRVGVLTEDWTSLPFTVTPLVETAPEISIKSELIQFHGVQADAEGNYVLLYSMFNSQVTESSVFAQRFDRTGQRIGGEILVTTERFVSGIDLAMNAAGEFVVSWRRSPVQDNPPVSVRRFAADGTAIGGTIRMDIEPASHAATSVAIDDAGNFVVAWSSLDANGQSRVWIQRFTTNGTLLGDRYFVGTGEQAQVAISASGDYVVVWQQGPQGPVYAQLFLRDGSKRGERIEIGSSAATNSRPSVAMSASGALAVLYRPGDGNVDLLIQRFDANGTLAGPVINVTDPISYLGGLGESMLSMDRAGRMVATWRSTIIYAIPQIYPPVFPPLIHSYAHFFDANGAAIASPVRHTGQVTFGANGAVVFAEYRTSNVGITNSGDSYLPIMRNPWQLYPFHQTGIYVRHYILPTTLTVDLNGYPPGVDYKVNLNPGGAPVPIGDSARLVIHGASSDTVTSATVSILQSLSGDLLALSVTKPGITATFSQGVLTLSGVASVADYQEVLRGLRFSTTAARAVGSTVEIRVVVSDGAVTSSAALSKISIHVPGRSSIAGRHIFYNNSGFDGNDPAANSGDDAAIATDKTALLPDQTATFANYTSYSRGINGIIVDLAGEHGTITADDFIFRIGNVNDPAHWAYAPQPLSVVVRAGAGVGGSDRVEIVWADGVIKNAWLQIIVLDNGDTGLAASDVFMFGNQVGEAGNEAGDTRVGAVDVMRIVNRLLAGGDRTAPIDSTIDFNRDGQITVIDLMAALNQALADDPDLKFIRVEDESAMDGAIISGLTAYIAPPIGSVVIVGQIVATLLPPEASPAVAWQLENDDLESLATQVAMPPQLLLDPNAN